MTSQPMMFRLRRIKCLAVGALVAGLPTVVAVWRIRAAWAERDLAFVASASRLPLPIHLSAL